MLVIKRLHMEFDQVSTAYYSIKLRGSSAQIQTATIHKETSN